MGDLACTDKQFFSLELQRKFILTYFQFFVGAAVDPSVMTESEMFAKGHILVPRYASLIKLKGSPCSEKSHIDSQEAVQYIELIRLRHVVKYATTNL